MRWRGPRFRTAEVFKQKVPETEPRLKPFYNKISFLTEKNLFYLLLYKQHKGLSFIIKVTASVKFQILWQKFFFLFFYCEKAKNSWPLSW